MDIPFLSCKSSVSGSVLSLSLTDDTQRDLYSFSSWASMMAATLLPNLLITHNAGQGWPFGLRSPLKQDVHHSLCL